MAGQRLHFDSRAIFIPDMGEQGEQRGNGHVPQRSQVARVVQDLSTPHNTQAVYVLIGASRALAYSWSLLRERRECREHREQWTRRVNLWKSRRLRYHSGPIKKIARLAHE